MERSILPLLRCSSKLLTNVQSDCYYSILAYKFTQFPLYTASVIFLEAILSLPFLQAMATTSIQIFTL